MAQMESVANGKDVDFKKRKAGGAGRGKEGSMIKKRNIRKKAVGDDED